MDRPSRKSYVMRTRQELARKEKPVRVGGRFKCRLFQGQPMAQVVQLLHGRLFEAQLEDGGDRFTAYPEDMLTREN